MIFRPLPLRGAWLIESEKVVDERGSFGRLFCREEFLKHGLNPHVEQMSFSRNLRKGTLRGMHFQVRPNAEVKCIRVTRGSVLDVIVDLQPDSPTYLQHVAVPLDQHVPQVLYVPEMFGHGLQSLEDDTEVIYQMSVAYAPAAARGFRYNDPTINIAWPLEKPILNERDASAPFFSPELLEPLR